MSSFTAQEVLYRGQLTWIPDEVSKVESSLSSFEQHNEKLLDRIRLYADTMSKWKKFQAATTQWFDDYLERQATIHLSYADIVYLLVSKVIETGRRWILLAT